MIRDIIMGKVGYAMITSPDFCMEKYRDDDHEEDAPHFTALGYLALFL